MSGSGSIVADVGSSDSVGGVSLVGGSGVGIVIGGTLIPSTYCMKQQAGMEQLKSVHNNISRWM